MTAVATSQNLSIRLRDECERNVLRGIVQKPSVFWPTACILQDGEFSEYRTLFVIIRKLICSALMEGREQAFSTNLLINVTREMGLEIDPDLIASLFELFHESKFVESVSFLRGDRVLSPSDIDTMSQHKSWCQQINGSSDGTATAQPRTFGGRSVGDLWGLSEQPVEWLVDGIFSCDQPTIFGAKQKSLKTTLLTDLAVSLASGLAWLGKFNVPQKRRVLFVTGEASEAAAIRKVRRAAYCRNLCREDLQERLRIEAMMFPTLPSFDDCRAVQDAVKEHLIDVVLLDPLYMGLQGLNTTNLTEVGPAMRQFMAHCRPANVIIAHHVKKTASFDDAPNLEDLSQAGIAEFAGNYWLMGRIGEYTGDGLHSLAIRYGGRDEQFGLLKLDFDERAWTADFSSLLDHRDDQQARKETERVNAMTAKILSELKRYPDGISEYSLATAIGTKRERSPFQTALAELEQRGVIVLMPEFVASNKSMCRGWKLMF